MRWLLLLAAMLGFAAPASAHRLDEYLQAATINLARDRLSLRARNDELTDLVNKPKNVISDHIWRSITHFTADFPTSPLTFAANPC